MMKSLLRKLFGGRHVNEVASWWQFCRASSARLAADPDIASAREHLERRREDWRIAEQRRLREERERREDEQAKAEAGQKHQVIQMQAKKRAAR